MKVRVYGAKEEEIAYSESLRPGYPLELTYAKEVLGPDTVELTKGYDAVWIVTACKITEAVARSLQENGVKYVVTRSAGYDHMDLAAMKQYGLRGANVPFYSPWAISEHAILTALSLLRLAKKQQKKIAAGDYTLAGVQGKELHFFRPIAYSVARQWEKVLY